MHELQNPMTGIRNLESQLREGFVTRGFHLQMTFTL